MHETNLIHPKICRNGISRHWAFCAQKLHFAVFSDAEIAQKQHQQIPKNTLKSESNAHQIFTKYLEEQDGIVKHDNWVYPDKELDAILVKFWFSLRKPGGEKYTIANLQNIKNALNRQMQCKGRNLDISKDTCYVNSQRAFRDACRELKSEGLGHVKNYPEIEGKGTETTIFRQIPSILLTAHAVFLVVLSR